MTCQKHESYLLTSVPFSKRRRIQNYATQNPANSPLSCVGLLLTRSRKKELRESKAYVETLTLYKRKILNLIRLEAVIKTYDIIKESRDHETRKTVRDK